MNNKIPDDKKRIKISVSIDPEINKKIDELLENRFYKKSRLIEFLLKNYIDENDNKSY
jgi:metal-responsive CopG/Arc/MetJ family transcriptional regulator